MRMLSLIKRSLTGGLVVALTIGAIYALEGICVPILFWVVMNMGLYEWQGLCNKMGYRIPCFWLFLLGNSLYLSIAGFYFEGLASALDVVWPFGFAWLGVFSMAAMFVFSVFMPEKGRWTNLWLRMGMIVAGVMYIALPLALLTWGASPARGGAPDMLMGFFVLIWSSDVFAYLFGSLLGKYKLCERLSPSKTWEGAAGGFMMALVAGLLWGIFVLEGIIPLGKWMGISVFVIFCGMLGDLVESKLKREAGVKDSGSILPGHGGILDRFDHVCRSYDYITAEGSGGILCPLRFDEQKIQLEDFIKARSLACLMIADAGLGTINAVVLTAEYMKARAMPVKGIIFNHYEPGNPLHEDNRRMCETMTGLKVVACVKEGDTELDIPLELLEELYEENGGTEK